MSKIVRNGNFQHLHTNRLLSRGKTITNTLHVKELEHRGEVIDINTISSQSPFKNVVEIQQEPEGLEYYVIPTPTTSSVLYSVQILSENAFFMNLPTLAEGQTCTLGFTNTTFFMVGPTILLISPSEDNYMTSRFYGPMHNQGNFSDFAGWENFLLVNMFPGQIIVLYGEGKDGYTNWYAVESSFGWFISD